MNLDIGDKVLVITNSYDYEYKDLSFMPDMDEYSYKIMTIDIIESIDKRYYMIEDKCRWCWDKDWIMKVGV